MRSKPSHLRAALRQTAAQDPEAKASSTMLAMADQLRHNPSDSARRVAEALLGIDDVPGELWADPLPPADTGERMLSVAIDRLSSEWSLTSLHRLVALRRVAWAAAQLARVVEKELDAASKGQ